MNITTSKKLIHNTFFNISADIVKSVIAFFLISYFILKLGKEVYGIWVLVGSIFACRGMLSIGLFSAVNRFIPVALAKDDRVAIKQVLSSASIFMILVAIMLFVATIIIYNNFNKWFEVPEHLIGVSKILVLVVGVSFSVAVPFQLSGSILSSYQRYDLIAIGDLAPIIIRAILLFILLSRGHGLMTLGIVFAASELAIHGIHLIFAKKLIHNLDISFKAVEISLLRKMLAYGTNTLLYTMGDLIIYKASDIVIGIFMTTSAVASYSVISAIFLMMEKLILSFIRAIRPTVSDLDARNDEEKIRYIAIGSAKYCLIFLIPSITILVSMGKEFLQVWLGDDFGQLHIILIILAVGHFFRLSQHSNFVVLSGKGYHQVFGVLTVSMAVAAVILGIFTIKVLKLGLLGIALSNSVLMIIVCGLILPAFFNRRMKISTKENFHYIWGPAFLGCAPTIALTICWKFVHPPNNLFQICLFLVSAMIMTLAGSWVLSLTDKEKGFLLDFVSFKER